jgi:hypothetical protein
MLTSCIDILKVIYNCGTETTCVRTVDAVSIAAAHFGFRGFNPEADSKCSFVAVSAGSKSQVLSPAKPEAIVDLIAAAAIGKPEA